MTETPPNNFQIQAAAMRKAVAGNPDKLIQMSAQLITRNVLGLLKDERGVRIEDALGIIGAFAGFACANQAIDLSRADETMGLRMVTMENGEEFIVGEAINHPLVNDKYSFYSLICSGLHKMGVTEWPDVGLMAKAQIASFSTAEFGKPDLPNGHQLRDTPYRFLILLWPRLNDVIHALDPTTAQLPTIFGLSAQEIIHMGKDAIRPDIAAEIAMKSAFCTSPLIPAKVVEEMQNIHTQLAEDRGEA